MAAKIQAIRGMNDILPEHIAIWQRVESVLRLLARQYGYQEIRLPILEKTELFKRCIGSVTDIVEKEMYTFIDRNGDSLSLRPEGTVGCVRGIWAPCFDMSDRKKVVIGNFINLVSKCLV